MSLHNLQAEIVEALFSDALCTSGLVEPAQHLYIHKNNILTQLINTLQDTFPLIEKLVGEDFFRVTAKEYLKHYPSRSGNLYDYGEYFSDFLKEFRPLKDLTYLPEVAHFEWACHTAFSAASFQGSFNTDFLKQLAIEQYANLNFVLNPSCQLIKFHFPLLQIIDLCKNKLNTDVNINAGGVNLLIIYRDFNLSLIPLTLGEFTFLTKLQLGQSLAQALAAALDAEPQFELEIKLPLWIQDKIIVDVLQR